MLNVAVVNRWVAAGVLVALLPATAAGQLPVPADSSRLIRAIQIRRYDIFSPSETRDFITRTANALHFMTRSSVVRRELLFRPDQPFDSASVAETARNLRGLGVFRAVDVDSVRTDSGLVMRVTTADGWSTRPITYFKSSGKTIIPTLGVEELNFLGTATLLSVRWRKDPDRSTLTTSFRQPRLLAGRIGLAAWYSHLSDGNFSAARLDKPWFSLSGRNSWSLYAETRQETVLRFFDGATVPRDTLARRYQLLSGAAARALRAGPGGYIRVGLTAQLRRDDYANKSRSDTLGRSITGAVGPYFQWRKAHFLVSKGLEGFAREQDVDVSTAIGVSVTATPRGFGYAEDGAGLFVSGLTGFGQPHAFVQLQASGGGRFIASGLDSGSVQLSSTAFLLPGPRHMAVFYAAAGWQENPLPGGNFDFGISGESGPRGFKQHAFTGDRAFFTTAEYRYTATENFLNLTAIGVAAFADYGGAWYHGSAKQTGWAVGTGLRLGLTRSTDTQVNRIDAVIFKRTGWDKPRFTIVIEKGYAFSSTGLIR